MLNIKKVAPFILLLTLNQLHADTAGGEISLGFFNHQPNGNASYKGSAVDIEDTLGFSEEQDTFIKAYLEHPLPFIPNLKLGYTALSHEGSSSVNEFTWGDTTYNGTIESSLSLDMSDVTLYYEFLDNWAETDAGLTFRYVSGDIAVHSSVSRDVADFSAWVPMLYGKVRFTLPATDLSFQLEANAISYWDITAYDYELSARYTLAMGVGLEAGYKAFHLESDELLNGFDANVDFSGPYAAAIWDF
ncbi:TIGR04219 family outer membrane beta-barrel protein [Sulfurovum sp. XGS-02]|uniref:TIGR04219 family outer membrane beta-barrel protein n=1 Tax=Sulfurovum sp. XGS-02 TaxID=2925411 RepID=UPI00204C68D6|nr:TIGR04219 family outer membrane beta-barrel protein [Sulfurovum sp. XGS-02]UPT77574.1 TIGR04219 family outer membrane beta-barrel protein [Sulfurovum sp. XGS-02]